MTHRLTALKNKAKKEGWAKYIRSESDERALLDGCIFNKKRAEYVVQWFPANLTLTKDPYAGKPFDLFDWQIDGLMMPLFGWERQDENGRWVRRFTKAYVEIPKKNGKSSLCSGICLNMLTRDFYYSHEGDVVFVEGAEVYCAAKDRNQAGIVWREASIMGGQSPELDLYINKGSKLIAYEAVNNVCRALSGDGAANEGLNATCIVADELHRWTGNKASDFYESIKDAGAVRPQPLFFQITTAGDDVLSICKQQHDYAKGVLDGSIEDSRFFGFIRAADPQDDPWDEATWFKANPGLGQNLMLEEIRNKAEEARLTPRETRNFKRRRLNIWLESADPLLNKKDWLACKGNFTPEDLYDKPCWAGLDLSRTEDSTSLQLVFLPEDEIYRVLSYIWYPQEAAEEQRGMVPWTQWHDRGDAILIPGRTIKDSWIEKQIVEVSETFDLRGVVYDSRMACSLIERLEDHHQIRCESFDQGFRNFAEPTDEFIRLVLDGEISHMNNLCMNWQVGNASVITNADSYKKIVKPKVRDFRKIDGVIALVMGLAYAMLDDKAPSVYETRGLLTYD